MGHGCKAIVETHGAIDLFVRACTTGKQIDQKCYGAQALANIAAETSGCRAVLKTPGAIGALDDVCQRVNRKDTKLAAVSALRCMARGVQAEREECTGNLVSQVERAELIGSFLQTTGTLLHICKGTTTKADREAFIPSTSSRASHAAMALVTIWSEARTMWSEHLSAGLKPKPVEPQMLAELQKFTWAAATAKEIHCRSNLEEPINPFRLTSIARFPVKPHSPRKTTGGTQREPELSQANKESTDTEVPQVFVCPEHEQLSTLRSPTENERPDCSVQNAEQINLCDGRHVEKRNTYFDDESHFDDHFDDEPLPPPAKKPRQPDVAVKVEAPELIGEAAAAVQQEGHTKRVSHICEQIRRQLKRAGYEASPAGEALYRACKDFLDDWDSKDLCLRQKRVKALCSLVETCVTDPKGAAFVCQDFKR